MGPVGWSHGGSDHGDCLPGRVRTHLLGYPLRETGPGWVRVYHRFFYPALIPILLILAIAAWRQIQAYGITEQRYLCCLLLLWLAILTAFSLRARWWRPVLVPAVLALLLVVASAGPWNPRDAALASQMGRLGQLLDRAGLVEDDRLIEPGSRAIEIEPATVRASQEIVGFLVARNGHSQIAQFWPDPPDWSHQRASGPRERRDLERRILVDLGLPVDAPEVRPAHFRNPDKRTFDVAGFERGGSLLVTRQRPPEPSLLDTAAGAFTLAFDHERQELEVNAPDGILFTFPFELLAQRLAVGGQEASFAIDQASRQHRVRLVVRVLDGNWRTGSSDFELKRLDALILVE